MQSKSCSTKWLLFYLGYLIKYTLSENDLENLQSQKVGLPIWTGHDVFLSSFHYHLLLNATDACIKSDKGRFLFYSFSNIF